MEEDADGGGDSARGAAEEVADERGGREQRAGGELPDCDGVQQLGVGEPAPRDHEVATQEREQDVAAAEEQRSDLEEEGEDARDVGVLGVDAGDRRCSDECD